MNVRPTFNFKRGVDLVVFEARRDPKGDNLMLVASIGVKELKSNRAAVCRMGNPRPVSLLLGVSDFEPSGPEGQLCPLRLSCPKRNYIEGRTDQWPARRPGVRVRNLARLYEDPLGERPFALEGWLENTNLTRLLKHLTEEAGGELPEVELIIRRTPMRTEKRPVWTLCIALPGESRALK